MSSEILHVQKGNIGHITLNRPKSLNALTLNMIQEMSAVLRGWSDQDDIHAVLVTGTGDRAFCAGGDVKAVYESGKSGGDLGEIFFREEYRLNHLIHTYSKPYISILDGITMGGGAGVSINGSHRIVTENCLFAMPETGIGLFPDVGGSKFLNDCPGKAGLYLGLTGAKIKAADMIYLGLATHYVKAENILEFIDRLFNHDGDVEEVIGDYAIPDDNSSQLARLVPLIEQHFSAKSLEDIIFSLQHGEGEFAKDTLENLQKKSPLSLKIAFKQLAEAKGRDFESCMQTEFVLSQACLKAPDYYEGVRAFLLDRDFAPNWSPASLNEITDAQLIEIFKGTNIRELTFS